MISKIRNIEEVEYNDVKIPLGKTIEQENIEIMKSIDVLEAVSNGGQISTDGKYIKAHKELQIYMNRTMNGEVYNE